MPNDSLRSGISLQVLRRSANHHSDDKLRHRMSFGERISIGRPSNDSSLVRGRVELFVTFSWNSLLRRKNNKFPKLNVGVRNEFFLIYIFSSAAR